MSLRNQYSTEEWRTILFGPQQAGSAIVFCSPSGLSGLLAENAALVGTLKQHLSSPERTPLLESIAAELLDPTVRETPTNNAARTPSELAEHAFQQVRQAVWLVSSRCPVADLNAYKRMLADIAHKVANAATEGGFLGIGGEKVSQAEREMLARLDEVLKIQEAPATESTAAGHTAAGQTEPNP